MDSKYLLQLSGHLSSGSDRDNAAGLLSRLFKISVDKASGLLQGKKTSLHSPLARGEAERLLGILREAGVECRMVPQKLELTLEPMDDAPSSESETPLSSQGSVVSKPDIVCPKCRSRQPAAAVCRSCGGILSGSRRASAGPRPRIEKGKEDTNGTGLLLLDRVLKSAFALLTIVAAVAHMNKDELPDASFYDLSRLSDPIQTETRTQPFKTAVNGIEYTINPLFDYDLRAVVVSHYISDSLGDIYHHDKWKDFINIKDLCVIWGRNVASAVYKEMSFDNSPWICWAYWPNREVGNRFVGDQLSNNHLLSNDPRINEAIMDAEPGDQIHLKGVLASYSHSNNSFYRGTSTSRTDTGNGACETIFVTDFEIERKANSGWRKVYAVTGVGAILSLIGVLVMLFIAPVRRRV